MDVHFEYDALSCFGESRTHVLGTKTNPPWPTITWVVALAAAAWVAASANETTTAEKSILLGDLLVF
jgi:hypothetical protein